MARGLLQWLVFCVCAIGFALAAGAWIYTADRPSGIGWMRSGDHSQMEAFALGSGEGLISVSYQRIVVDKVDVPFRPWNGGPHRGNLSGHQRWFRWEFPRYMQSVYLANTEVIPGIGPVGHRRLDIDVAAPHWAVALALAVPPSAWIAARRIRQRSQRRHGLCKRCGYDLRATPDRCPECGADKSAAPALASGAATAPTAAPPTA